MSSRLWGLPVAILYVRRVLSWFGDCGMARDCSDAVQPSKSSVLSPKVASSTRAVGSCLFSILRILLLLSLPFLCKKSLKSCFKKQLSRAPALSKNPLSFR